MESDQKSGKKQIKKDIVLYVKGVSNMRLRSIVQTDIEDIRVWKNNNKNRFFYKQEILPEKQAEWYRGYVLREEDYIFMVESKTADVWEKVGCMGFRMVDGEIDLYNIMRGKSTGYRSSMRAAMRLLLAYIFEKYSCRIKCDVLVDNPAVEWYNKCGFSIKECKDNYYIMVFERNMVKLPCVDQEEI